MEMTYPWREDFIKKTHFRHGPRSRCLLTVFHNIRRVSEKSSSIVTSDHHHRHSERLADWQLYGTVKYIIESKFQTSEFLMHISISLLSTPFSVEIWRSTVSLGQSMNG